MKRIIPAALPVKIRPKNVKILNDFYNLGIDPILSNIFAARDFLNADEVITKNKGLLQWRDMLGADVFVKIIIEAIKDKKKIIIVADYDSDGATSCAIAVKALKSFGANVDFVVPNRFIHGYGLTVSVVDQVYQTHKPDIIITVDNGVSSHDGVKRAHLYGIKVLITDHHLVPDTLPEADCIVNPNQPGCKFKSKNMAGCGVIFYVMAALREELKNQNLLPPAAENISSLLDFVAIGTIADVVKLDENNRVLVSLGLKRIKTGKAHPGVAALFTVARRTMNKVTTKDIGFAIAPRINAAGRLDDMSIGIKCLLADEFQDAMHYALTLDDLNTERKEIELNMQDFAINEIISWGSDVPFGITIFNEQYHEGVIGILAGRIKDKEHRPTIIFAPAQEPGFIKGSGRSIPGFHLRDALDIIYKKYPNLISKFGGHSMAAGITIPYNALKDFQEAFNKICMELLTDDVLARAVYCDGDLNGSEISLNLAEKIANEVWGQGCPEPTFCSVFKIVEQDLIKETHLKLVLEKDNIQFKGIWFFKDKPFNSDRCELVYTIEGSEFRGDQFVQLQIVQGTEVFD